MIKENYNAKQNHVIKETRYEEENFVSYYLLIPTPDFFDILWQVYSFLTDVMKNKRFLFLDSLIAVRIRLFTDDVTFDRFNSYEILKRRS